MKMAVTIVALVCFVVYVKALSQGCQNGWTRQGDVCILFSDTKETFTGAALKCADKGGNLADPSNANMDKYIGNTGVKSGVIYWIALPDLGRNETNGQCDWQRNYVCQAQPKTCGDLGYSELQTGFCVKNYETPKSSPDSKSFCESEGGRLVRIDTADKFKALKDHLIAKTVKTNVVYYIDGTKSSGTWVFSDNTPVPTSVIQWAWGEPNNWASDNCLSLFTTGYLFGDTTCFGQDWTTFNFGFICEIVF